MRLELSGSATTAALSSAVAARLFYGLALDASEAANAAWLAAPVGFALALPVIWAFCKVGKGAARPLASLLFVPLSLDAAAAIECTAFSESCLALQHASTAFLMLPLLLAMLRCAWLGGDAVGGAARISARLIALLLFIVLLYQLPYFNPGWLTPIWGTGMTGILHSGIRAAGWIGLLCASSAIVCEDDLTPQSILPVVLFATAAATLLVALRQMMSPVMTMGHVDRAVSIDALLANGRAPLYLQLPMIVAWLVGMLHLMAFEGIAACALLHRLFPGLKEGICIALGLLPIAALSLLRVPRMGMIREAFPYLYHAMAVSAVILWIMKGGKAKCAITH